MSLIHWWPLVKDNNDYGLIGETSFSGDVVANGKLGQCRKPSANTGTFSNSQLQGKSISYAGWFKFNKSEISSVLTTSTVNSHSTTPTGNLIGNCSYGGIALCWESNNIYNDGEFNALKVFGYARNSSQSIFVTTGVFYITFDTWYHIAVVADRDNEKLNLYINGNQQFSVSMASNIELATNDFYVNVGWIFGGNGPGRAIPFYANDVRIYNHALSVKEVREISKGLMLHYNFEDPYVEGTTNVKPWSSTINSGTMTSWDTNKNDGSIAYYRDGWNSGYNGGVEEPSIGYHAHWVYLDGELVMKFPNKNSEVNHKGRWLGINGSITLPWSAGDKYTISLEQMTDNLNLKPQCGIYYKTTSSTGTSFYDGVPTFGPNTKTGVWERFSYTFTVNSAFDRSVTSAIVFVYGYNSTYEGTCYVRNIQIEYKDHATPFTPTSRPQGTISDNSGYNYNATVYGTDGVQILSGSPSGANYVHIPFTSTIRYLTNNFDRTDALTYSIWFRHYGLGTDAWTWLFTNGRADATGYGYGVRISSDTRISCYWAQRSEVGVDVPKEEWHLLTVSITGLTQTIYLDGVQKATGTATSLPTYENGTGLGLGCFYYNTTGVIYRSICDIADFKIYATALTSSDIMLEYNRKASIDKNGNIYSGEFVENENQTSPKVNKNDTFSSDNFAENIELDDGSVWTPIVVHNVEKGLFSTINKTYLYDNDEIWNSFGTINSIERPDNSWYEFLVMHQTSVNGAYSWWRFKQNVNPLTATWDQVNPSNVGTNVTRISTNASWSSGAGMYWYNDGKCPMCFANFSNGNWYGCGITTAYSGGIPGYNNEIVKGFQLVYIRTSKPQTKFFKKALIKANNIIEI